MYSATAIGTAGVLGGKSTSMNFYIDGVTSDEELYQVAAVLREKGPDGLENVFNKAKERHGFPLWARTETT